MEQKPNSMIIAEFRKTLETDINNSHLDPTLVYYILKDICRDVEQATNAILMNDVAKYNQMLTEKETKKENKDDK